MFKNIFHLKSKYKNSNNVFDKIKNYTCNGIFETYSMNIRSRYKYETLQKIINKNGLNDFSNCSDGVKTTIKIVYGIIEIERIFIYKEWKHLLKDLRKFRLIGAIKSAYSILFLFFTKEKCHKRIINIGKKINYKGIDNDSQHLKSIIKQTSNPEKKSIITYLLGKIKDKRMIKKFNKLGRRPSQFNLLLQQCKKGQIMLTNALNPDGSSSFFKELTQAISGSRRCHCLIISDVLKDKNGIVKDLKIIQSTLDGGVHEILFKKYIKENYSKADFLLASLPRDRRKPIILNAKNHIGKKYNRIAMLLDVITGGDFKYLGKDLQDVNKTYCTALVFDALEKSKYNIPRTHLTPSDILLVENLTPEYACYCDKL